MSGKNSEPISQKSTKLDKDGVKETKIESKLSNEQLDKASGGGGKVMEVQDYGFGVSMPVTSSRSDGGGSTVGR